jgi:hypothetical protein
MEILVAAQLRAMSFKARVTPKRGRDVIASPDGLGFQTPRIIGEVKHRLQGTDSRTAAYYLSAIRARGNGGRYGMRARLLGERGRGARSVVCASSIERTSARASCSRRRARSTKDGGAVREWASRHCRIQACTHSDNPPRPLMRRARVQSSGSRT